jgi:hypothetical protein
LIGGIQHITVTRRVDVKEGHVFRLIELKIHVGICEDLIECTIVELLRGESGERTIIISIDRELGRRISIDGELSRSIPSSQLQLPGVVAEEMVFSLYRVGSVKPWGGSSKCRIDCWRSVQGNGCP